MDRYLKQYDKDHMKMAMLKQEETFRHQVHELHRLYRVQKLMMNDMKTELKRRRKPSNSRNKLEIWNAHNQTSSRQQGHSCRDARRPQQSLDLELPAEEYIRKDDKDVEEDSILELTLATGSKSPRKKEHSSTSDSGASFSSSSTDGAKLNGNRWGIFQEGGFDVEEQMREERVKQPPWLFLCLNLKA